MKRAALLVCLSLAWGSVAASAQETHTAEAITPNGNPANAPMAREHRVKNWSSWGAGCCVVASNQANANFLGWQAIGRALHDRSLREAGGHYPEKLEKVFEDVKRQFPELRWTQFYNDPEGVRKLAEWNDLGFPIGITWGTGERYGMRPIAHMVSLIHIDGGRSGYWGVVDNNFPEEVSWVPSVEGERRWNMGGMPWGVVLVPPEDRWPVNPNKPLNPFGPFLNGANPLAMALTIACLLAGYAIAGATLIFVASKVFQPQPEDETEQ